MKEHFFVFSQDTHRALLTTCTCKLLRTQHDITLITETLMRRRRRSRSAGVPAVRKISLSLFMPTSRMDRTYVGFWLHRQPGWPPADLAVMHPWSYHPQAPEPARSAPASPRLARRSRDSTSHTQQIRTTHRQPPSPSTLTSRKADDDARLFDRAKNLTDFHSNALFSVQKAHLLETSRLQFLASLLHASLREADEATDDLADAKRDSDAMAAMQIAELNAALEKAERGNGVLFKLLLRMNKVLSVNVEHARASMAVSAIQKHYLRRKLKRQKAARFIQSSWLQGRAAIAESAFTELESETKEAMDASKAMAAKLSRMEDLTRQFASNQRLKPRPAPPT